MVVVSTDVGESLEEAVARLQGFVGQLGPIDESLTALLAGNDS